jgi:hypothetical protein
MVEKPVRKRVCGARRGRGNRYLARDALDRGPS